MSKRAIILMLDSLGIGSAPDAMRYGDHGSDTLGHIMAWRAKQQRPLCIPNLQRWGLVAAAELARTGQWSSIHGPIQGAWGFAEERSIGKDTPSGHWEMAGVPVLDVWGHFDRFPDELIKELRHRANLGGVLGNKAASGTDIINELGEHHIKSGWPIVYTSADSVFQIAAHQEIFGLERLYDVCQIARELVDDYHIARVIARPFVGTCSTDFKRTHMRRDWATPPPAETLLDRMASSGGQVVSIGKIADIYAHRGITKQRKAGGNADLFEQTLKSMTEDQGPTIIFTNFVDFDSQFGHRRDVRGYADALEDFDQRLPELEDLLQPNDLCLITADHGCDPTWPGTDHTRELVPVIVFGHKIKPVCVGRRLSFADIGATLAEYFGLSPLMAGKSFLSGIL